MLIEHRLGINVKQNVDMPLIELLSTVPLDASICLHCV